METAFAAIIAVAGTLLGATLTYIFQRRANQQLAAIGSRERARQERLDAYAAFGGSAVRFRVSGLNLWHRHDEGASDEAVRLATADYYRLRAELVDAELRVQLVSPVAGLHALMSDVIAMAHVVPEATSVDDRRARSTAAKAALSRFVAAASAELRQQPSTIG
ncbi:hypothetical protein EV650_1507 [Kribbella kalugense]|uniref:Uncharacterized protein n=1 Tax=Kribbella kalugense TaxID=2512221 RepID=A0A4R7ZX49_9ACTN|nr:hypothetical protein EV650_1507 [Kribbella kalugense]